MADDNAILNKLARGEPLTGNERFRVNQIAREQSQRGSNLRAWERGNRRSPN